MAVVALAALAGAIVPALMTGSTLILGAGTDMETWAMALIRHDAGSVLTPPGLARDLCARLDRKAAGARLGAEAVDGLQSLVEMVGFIGAVAFARYAELRERS